MHSVSRFEANLLRILYSLLDDAGKRSGFGQSRAAKMLPQIRDKSQRPACLSSDCVKLVESALAKGTVSFLAYHDAWLTESFLSGDGAANVDIRHGRLWERRDPSELGLNFSVNSLDFLVWLTAVDPLAVDAMWTPPAADCMTVGDHFLLFLAMSWLIDTEVGRHWLRQSVFAENGLIALVFVRQIAAEKGTRDADFSCWMTHQGSAVLECLQNELATAWLQGEQFKANVIDPRQMKRFGDAQRSVLEAFCRAANDAGRRDLCRFLLEVYSRLLQPTTTLRHFANSLNFRGMRLAERSRVLEAVVATLSLTSTLCQWNNQYRATGYFDDDYTASQLWKSDWERFSADESVQRAHTILGALNF